MNLLQIKASVFSGNGQSSRLADEFVAQLRRQNPADEVVERDLVAEPVPHLDGARVGAFFAKPEERSAEQEAVIAYSDALINELRRADVIVIGLPMYNFGVPSQLKAWFDHVARAGETFKYTEKGAVGLLTGKKAYVFAARGGVYAGTPNDWQTQFVRFFLGFIGITDVEFVYAEGLALGEESRNKGIAAAQAGVRRLAAQSLRAA
ncbi:MAG: FMN-dependent NADH-azoreductase [Betaproteobacteria bacterium RIFCSPLOWO2_12_FULL_65_14]|nr:MAG: FMN-dependent NADH-azoreductase [Betaproteobacteria bacterium RIFCSPLOWO2_12_FULL_65_14]